jgi:type IV pilus assembly protein PilM
MSMMSRLFVPPRPTVALEIASGRVAALRLGEGSPPLAAYAVEPLPPGVVVPSLTAPNIVDQGVVVAAVARVFESVGRGRRVALVVPDSVAKVSLVRFDQVPARAQDLDAMLRWQVRKSVPFRVEEAQVTWSEGQELDAGGREFIVTLARRELVAQYEAAVSAAGAHAGLVDLATFNLVSLVLAKGETDVDCLLVHAAADYVTLAIIRRGRLIFYRHRGADSDESLEDLVHQTAMYYEDRLAGGGFGRVLLAGAADGAGGAAGADRIRRALADRLRTDVEPMDLTGLATLNDRIAPSPALVDELAPLVGILSREPAA